MNPGDTATAVRYARTFLFVPGNRPERFAKAVAAQPDIVVIDLRGCRVSER
jgi:citrate lyase subunit beta/citryl-CoA lyase